MTIDWDTTTISPKDGESYWRAHGTEAPGPSRRTASGLEWFFLDPDPATVRVEDIAHHLARINRWGGSLLVDDLSVAQHAVMVALLAWTRSGGDPIMALWGLHHDDEEAYLGDMLGPAKKLPHMAYARWLGRVNQAAIVEALDLPAEEPELVKRIDRDLRIAERKAFMAAAATPSRGTYTDRGEHPTEFQFGDTWAETNRHAHRLPYHALLELGGAQLGLTGYGFLTVDPMVVQVPSLELTHRILPRWWELAVADAKPRGSGPLIIDAWPVKTAQIAFLALHRELVELRQGRA